MKQLGNAKKIILTLLAGIGLLLSCNKNNFLNKKSSSDLLVPTTLGDFQALLDNYLVMQETPELGELSADNFYLTYSTWLGMTTTIKEHNAYVWAQDIYGGQGGVEDWDDPYQQVFYANIVLDGLPGVAVDSGGKWKNLQGSAYFIRAYAFYNLAQVFAPVYGPKAVTDLGIPLRLNSAINQISSRASVQMTYDTIISELKAASSLLPGRDTAHLNRPSKPAALAMLARVYLSMGKYDSAGLYADSCLKIYNKLIDFNTLSRDTVVYPPFGVTNDETLYQSHLLTHSNVFGSRFFKGTYVDSNLYRSYADSDLRKYIFYTPAGRLNGTYSGGYNLFSGLAMDEIYLIRAECSVRANRPDSAADDLNRLLINRWVTGNFVPYNTATTTIDTVLAERRKELSFRSLRWTDLRRLNAEGKNITLTRSLNGIDSFLLPKSQRYVLPIPPDVIGIMQNPR